MATIKALPIIAALLTCVSISCSPQSGQSSDSVRSADSESEAIQPIPENRIETVRTAVNVGRALYHKDHLAARATDEVLKATGGKPDSRVRGWIVLDSEPPSVLFVGAADEALIPIYDVSFETPTPIVRTLPNGTPIKPEMELEFRARDLALRTKFMMCSDRYNTVVLPASIAGQRGWFVYMLAATTKPDLLVVGGHHRIHVSEDARTVLSVMPFSKSCINLPLAEAPPGAETVGAVVSHVLSDTPAETHVFLSLLHRKPIFVATALGGWEVRDGDIVYLGPLSEE